MLLKNPGLEPLDCPPCQGLGTGPGVGSTSGRTPPWNLRSVPRLRNSHDPIPGVGPPAARHPRLLAICVSRTRRRPGVSGTPARACVWGTRRGACIWGTSARGLRQQDVGADLARSPRRRRRCCVLIAWAVSWLHRTVLLQFGGSCVCPLHNSPANSACSLAGFQSMHQANKNARANASYPTAHTRLQKPARNSHHLKQTTAVHDLSS